MCWSDIIPCKCWWSHKGKRSWDTKVSQEKWSGKVSYFSFFESKSWESMKPVFSREKWRKWRTKLRHTMPKCASKCIAISCRSCVTIGIPPSCNNKDIRLVGSLGSGDVIFFSFFFGERNSFSIVGRNRITIFREYLFESTHDIVPVIRNREYSIVFFTLEWYSMSLEPFSTLFRRKLSHRPLDEFPSTSVFGCKDFLIRNSCGYIASSSSWYDDFFSWARVFLEEMDEIIFIFYIFEYGRRRHKSCSTGSDDRYRFHNGEYRENSRKRKSWQRII